MAKITKEWNGTIMKFSNDKRRAELSIDGRTVDFKESDGKFHFSAFPSYFMFLENKYNEIHDFLKGYDEKGNLIEVKVSCTKFGTLTVYFFYNGKKVYSEELGGAFKIFVFGKGAFY